MNRKSFVSIGVSAFIVVVAGASTIAKDLMADTWVATDGLGRKLPTAAEVGPLRTNRQVAIFYFLWHANYFPNGPKERQGPFDISKMLERDRRLMDHPDSPMFGPFGTFHHWGEPLLGYYVGTDRAVYRKHAQWLSDAGVDAVIFDTTNGPIYGNTVTNLLEAFAEYEAGGGRAPKIAFMCPFARTPPQGRRGTSLKRIYEAVYRAGLHPELWYRLDGKPLVLSYPSYCDPEPLIMLDAIGNVQRDVKLRTAPIIKQGRTYGQLFTCDKPFIRVEAGTPTHCSKSFCGAKLTLRRGGPGGEIVAERTTDSIADNSMTAVTLEKSAPPGTYLLEISEPVGSVSWWTRPAPPCRGAYLDGRRVDGYRHLRVTAADDEYTARMKAFFTFRDPTAGGYHHRSPAPNGAWAWAATWPQPMQLGPDGKGEMVSVSVALNSTVEKGPVPMNSPGAMGRRFHGGENDSDPKTLACGLCFQEQWNRALELDPPIVFVTGWNEWIMTRIKNWSGWEIPAGNFVDQYSPEFSRDAEPVRGYWGDAYYWQLAANIRRFKGARAVPRVVSAPIVVDGDFSDWREVEPEFRDVAGDPWNRDCEGWGNAGRYVDKTGRNDIIAAKVSRADNGVFFYVRTSEPLTEPEAGDWMRLHVDTDCNALTSPLGYELVIEPAQYAAGKTPLKPQHVKAAVGKREIELFVAAEAFPDSRIPDCIDFKWTDNCADKGDWTDFTLHGDAAPNDRFNYRAVLGN